MGKQRPAARTARNRKTPTLRRSAKARRCKHTGRAVAILGVDVEAYACRKCDAVGVRPVGRSSDDSPTVQVEMRAAELADPGSAGKFQTAELWGNQDHCDGGDIDDDEMDDADRLGYLAGWLVREMSVLDDATAWAWDISRPLAEQLVETAADDAAAASIEALRSDPLYAKVMEANVSGPEMPTGREPWSRPVDSNECAIRRQCTNKCGRRDDGHHGPAVIVELLVGEDFVDFDDTDARWDATAQAVRDKHVGPLAFVELLVGPEPEQGVEFEVDSIACTAPHDGECQPAAWNDGPMVCVVPLRAEPDCRDEDGPEVERIMAEMERESGPAMKRYLDHEADAAFRRIPTLNETLDRQAGVMRGLAEMERREHASGGDILIAEEAAECAALSGSDVCQACGDKWTVHGRTCSGSTAEVNRG